MTKIEDEAGQPTQDDPPREQTASDDTKQLAKADPPPSAATNRPRRSKAASMTSANWFEVDAVGLGQTVARRPKDFIVNELAQNAFDEAGVRRFSIDMIRESGSRMVTIEARDDSSRGVERLADLFTIYAPSSKKTEAEKRGRFNVGEKTVISMSDWASIISTSGGLIFDTDGRRPTTERTERGTLVKLKLRLTRDEQLLCEAAVRKLIAPKEITVFLNGQEMPKRVACSEFTASLPTEIADEEGNLRRTVRATVVRLYEVAPGEVAAIHEMGIPVVDTGDLYHIDVQQKVPLSVDRDNVTPAYLRTLRMHVLNHMHEEIPAEAITAGWVNSAMTDRDVSGDAVRTVIEGRFGPKAVTFDPSDPESNKLAVVNGYNVVHGGSFPADIWDNIRKADALLPAGRVTPSPKPFDEYGMPIRLVPKSDWTEAEKLMVFRFHKLAQAMLGVPIGIVITDQSGWAFLAAYGPSRILYLGRTTLGRQFFEGGLSERALSLLIHELGHHYASDHLSRDYHDALTRLGARLARIAATQPSLLPL